MRTETLEFFHGDWDSKGVTLEQLRDFMKERNVPDNARIWYAGCGSHRIEFVWEVEIDEDTTTHSTT